YCPPALNLGTLGPAIGRGTRRVTPNTALVFGADPPPCHLTRPAAFTWAAAHRHAAAFTCLPRSAVTLRIERNQLRLGVLCDVIASTLPGASPPRSPLHDFHFEQHRSGSAGRCRSERRWPMIAFRRLARDAAELRALLPTELGDGPRWVAWREHVREGKATKV